ncbi:predicted protein [Naegleria gruberi]|uniref:Predicted protein n=1 Tax=Naegleria gruberi TaxID=5762 RepID=D2W019_NAEGR|nr:uncharacterized protein NAEGRDRAFT_74699 [Naegleria gruberi]EFC37671.1 predicted protein [Naegleria gruberi]|eukprot:XP_002670415.1 predicted protein [Naegleria gruberi strain NEG-M]
MNELYELVYNNIDITIESFYDLIKSLYNDVDLDLFKQLRINLINFAIENYKYLNLLQKFKQLPICMRDDLIEKMLSIQFIDIMNENDQLNEIDINGNLDVDNNSNKKRKRKQQDENVSIQPNSKERK